MTDATRGDEKKRNGGAADRMLLPEPERGLTGQQPAVLLAMCLFGEARGESDAARQAVAQVILNRARTPHRVFGSRADRSWEENLRRVILKPWQFSCFLPDDPNCAKLLRPLEHASAAVWQRCVDAAQRALEHGDEPDALTLNSDHYFDDSLQTPTWADPSKQTVLIGRLRFYRLYLPLPTAGAAYLLRIGAEDGSLPNSIAAGDAAATPSCRESSPPESSCRTGAALLGENRGEQSRRHRREGSGSGSYMGHPALHHPSQRTPRLGPNRWFQWSRGLSSLGADMPPRNAQRSVSTRVAERKRGVDRKRHQYGVSPETAQSPSASQWSPEGKPQSPSSVLTRAAGRQVREGQQAEGWSQESEAVARSVFDHSE